MEKPASTKVLITVMTYPHPSEKSDEVVCTAGITDSNEWVRLYPIDYRYRSKDQQFHKYQWIDVELGAGGAGNDNRKESRKPKLETIRLLGQPLPTDDGWLVRRTVVDRMQHNTILELKEFFERDRTSLGIVRPSRVYEVKVEPAERLWKPEWEALYTQMRLFGDPPKPLMKLPFKFSYVFDCSDSTKPHNAMIEDWELGALFLKMRDQYDEAKAAQIVRDKYFDMCAPDRDTRFFVGTTFPYNAWVVVGVFWPPLAYQSSLGLK